MTQYDDYEDFEDDELDDDPIAARLDVIEQYLAAQQQAQEEAYLQAEDEPALTDQGWEESFLANVVALEEKLGRDVTNRELQQLYEYADATDQFEPELVKPVDLLDDTSRVEHLAEVAEDQQAEMDAAGVESAAPIEQ